MNIDAVGENEDNSSKNSQYKEINNNNVCHWLFQCCCCYCYCYCTPKYIFPLITGRRKGKGGGGKKGSALVRNTALDITKHLHNNTTPPPKKNLTMDKVTCPGFPGYCSESYPGDICLVVCAFGRNNVPQCQVSDQSCISLPTDCWMD